MRLYFITAIKKHVCHVIYITLINLPEKIYIDDIIMYATHVKWTSTTGEVKVEFHRVSDL